MALRIQFPQIWSDWHLNVAIGKETIAPCLVSPCWSPQSRVGRCTVTGTGGGGSHPFDAHADLTTYILWQMKIFNTKLS